MSDDRSATICQQMREIRSALRDDAATIVENAKLTLDWRHYVKRYPWTCMAIAAALGYFIVPRGRPRLSMDRRALDEMAQRLKSTLPASPTEQSKGFLMGIAVPMLAKAAMQGGVALLQRRFQNPADGRAQPQQESSKRRPSHPR